MMEVLKEYSKKRLELLKLEATEKGVTTAGTMVLIVLFAVFGIFCLILLNIGVAILIGEKIANYWLGFLIVAGIYLLLMGILILVGKKVKRGIANLLLRSIQKEEKD